MPSHTAEQSRNWGFSRLLSDLNGRYPAPPGAAGSSGAASLPTPGSLPLDPEFEHRLERLPPEIGALLIVIGVAGIMLPGPVGSPFVLAGGLVLWPKGFGRVERWFERRFPGLHREGVTQIERFLSDLERRYPGSIR